MSTTTSSAWLESLGRASLTGESISSTNYAEFEQDDLVKAVNKNMDSVTQGIEEEALAAADFYRTWHTNKQNQWKSILEITKTGGELAVKGATWLKAENEYNDWIKKTLNNKVDEDPDIINEQERQEKIEVIEGESQALAKELEKDGVEQDLINQALEAGGLIKDNYDTKKEARSLIKDIYPGWRDILADQEFQLKDGTIVSLNKAATREQYDELDAIINKLFIAKVSEMGYNKGFMKQNIFKPMFKQSKLDAEEWAKGFDKARLAATKKLRIENLADKVQNQKDYEAVLTSISRTHENDEVSYNIARAKTVQDLLLAVNDRQLTASAIEDLGDYEFIGHDGEVKKFSKYWEKEYLQLYNAAVDLEKADSEARAKSIEIAKTNLETSTIKGWQKSKQPLTLDDVQEAEEAWKSNAGWGDVPQSYQTMRTILERGENYDELIANVKKKLLTWPQQQLLYTDIMQLPVQDQEKYSKFIGAGGLFGTPRKAHDENVLILTQSGITANANDLGIQAGNTNSTEYINAKNQISDAFTEAYFTELSIPSDAPIETIIDNATRKGIQAAKNKAASIFSPENVHLLKQSDKPTDAQLERDALKKFYTDGINKATIDLKSPQVFAGEQGAITAAKEYALKISQGKPAKVPAIWTYLASGRKDMDGHDLAMFRLEATGNLPKGYTPKYNGPIFSDKAYSLLNEKNTGSRTYRVITGEGANIAEAFLALSVNKDKNGYDTVLQNDVAVEPPKPFSQMNLQELQEYITSLDNNGYKAVTVGMYNIPLDLFAITANKISKIEGYGKFAEEGGDISGIIMDQDMQDRVALYLMKENANKGSQNISINQTWTTPLNLPKDYLKEIKDLDPIFKQLDENHPMMQLEHMLPDVAKAVVKAATQ